VGRLVDVDVLNRIIWTDSDQGVRCAAIGQLSNEAQIEKVASGHFDHEARIAAWRKLDAPAQRRVSETFIARGECPNGHGVPSTKLVTGRVICRECIWHIDITGDWLSLTPNSIKERDTETLKWMPIHKGGVPLGREKITEWKTGFIAHSEKRVVMKSSSDQECLNLIYSLKVNMLPGVIKRDNINDIHCGVTSINIIDEKLHGLRALGNVETLKVVCIRRDTSTFDVYQFVRSEHEAHD
jgi:hypothetical protein